MIRKLKKNVTEEFLKAKSEIINNLEKNKDFMPALNYDYREAKDQIAEFGGRLYFKFINPTKEEKKKNSGCQTCVVKIEGKPYIEARGTNMANTKEKLREILGLK